MGRRPSREVLIGVLAASVAVAVCAQAPWRDLAGLLAASQGRLPLTLVMWPVSLGFDAWAWRILLRALGVESSWFELWLIRLVSEAVLLSWPGGSVLAEIVKVGLLCRRREVSVAAVAASLAVKKALVIGTEAPYLVLAAALGARHGLTAVLVVLPAIAAIIALGAAWQLGWLTVRSAWATRLASAAASVRARGGRFAPLAGHLEDLRGSEELVRKLWRAGWCTLGRASSAVFVAWLCEGLDLAVASWAMGTPLRPWQALFCDALAGFVRAAAFVIPGGWGAQDLGLVGLVKRVAYRTEAAAAWLVVIKRAKEVFFVVTGYSLGLAIKAAWRNDRRERTRKPRR